MRFPSDPATFPVAVIGAGTMGAGIALVAARAGHSVLLYDARMEAIDSALASLADQLTSLRRKGRLDDEECTAILARLMPAAAMADLAPAGLVVEAIVENIEIKSAVLRQIEAVVGADTIIATNSSSLSITALAARLERPRQFGGMHFFNPAPILPLVEIIGGKDSAPETLDRLTALARFWGKEAVRCASTPGFLVNRIARPFYGEALRLLEEKAADCATIDAIQRDCGGFRMGPFELMDLIGHDVNFAVTQSVYAAMFQDRRYLPSLLQQELVDAGWLGRKTKRGFYDYREGASAPCPNEAGTAPPPDRVWISGSLGPAHKLIEMARVAGLSVAHKGNHDHGEIRLSGVTLRLTDGRLATEHTAQADRPVVLFDLALDYGVTPRIAIAAAEGCGPDALAQATGFFQAMGKKVSVIDDVPGLIVARTVAMLVNEASDVLHQGLASASDIDLAMQKGVNYPCGPLAWGDTLGPKYVAAVINALAAAYGDGRYRCSPLLRRRAIRHTPPHP